MWTRVRQYCLRAKANRQRATDHKAATDEEVVALLAEDPTACVFCTKTGSDVYCRVCTLHPTCPTCADLFERSGKCAVCAAAPPPPPHSE